MTAKHKHYLAIGTLLLLAIVITTTLANKAWWWKRINAKWVFMEPYFDEELGVHGWSVVGLDKDRYSLAEMVGLYFKGSEGWQRRDEPEPTA